MKDTMRFSMLTKSVGHHYSHFLRADGKKLADARNSDPLGPMFTLNVNAPRDLNTLRSRQSVSATGKCSGSAISQTIALHQRKLRVTEARIDHALDLVTRSFGVNQAAPLASYTITSPEAEQVRDTLSRTQRIQSELSPSTRSKKARYGTSQRKLDGGDSKQKTKSVQPLKIYKANPVLAPVSILASPIRTLSRDKIDRNKMTQLCVVRGNTHIYDETPPDFINTFARMDSLKTTDDVNPAGLPRFQARVDMKGFADHQITFKCDGKKVSITGNRPKKNSSNARRVVEVLELPPGIFPEKLRVARDSTGELHVQERWTID